MNTLAKVVLGVLGAAATALGLFVTRWEYQDLHTDVREIRADIRTIMWRVGGPEARDVKVAAPIPCFDESTIEGVDEWLTMLWAYSQEIANLSTDAPRPHFCFVPGVIVEEGREGRLLGAYNHKNNSAIVGLTQEEISKLGRCVVIHEMLHALVGPDEVRVRELMEGANELCVH